MNTALVLVVACLAIVSVVQAFTDPRLSRAYTERSLIALAAYAAHAAIGIWLLISVVPQDIAPGGIAVAFLGWAGLGLLGLIRLTPRLREPPAPLLRFGLADIVCLLLVGGGLAAATGLLPT